MPHKINKAGLNLVKEFEGFSADAYLCPAGVWTIGYGHTADVREGQNVTKAKAEQLLREDLSDAETAVERYLSVPLTDCQFSALVSFTFNLGAGNLRESTLRRKLNAGNYDAVPSELARWVKAGGKTLEGPVRRRAAEGVLFLIYNHFVVRVGKTAEGQFIMNDPATSQDDGYTNITEKTSSKEPLARTGTASSRSIITIRREPDGTR